MQQAEDQMQTGGARELPRYKSHKQVWALKIKAIDLATPQACTYVYKGGAECGYDADQPMHTGTSHAAVPVNGRHEFKPPTPSKPGEEFVGAFITPVEEGYAALPVTFEYLRKHKPQVGGYYVVYADGYKSWSPAQAFEEGYTRAN
jgi:hypothetical protein